jgi:hypothetical protein
MQRHAHRRLSQLVMQAKLGFGDLGAGRDGATDDVVPDALVGAIVNRGWATMVERRRNGLNGGAIL